MDPSTWSNAFEEDKFESVTTTEYFTLFLPFTPTNRYLFPCLPFLTFSSLFHPPPPHGHLKGGLMG